MDLKGYLRILEAWKQANVCRCLCNKALSAWYCGFDTLRYCSPERLVIPDLMDLIERAIDELVFWMRKFEHQGGNYVHN